MTASAFGKYRVVRKIGEGGFGEVYEGVDPHLNRRVAIKICASRDQELRRRFAREAEIAASLRHPNIVSIFDFGHQDGTPYLVQEYLSGEDLRHKIERREALDEATIHEILRQIAEGLSYAHSRDVVHRDVKPANLRILDDGQVRIMDFGIAKLLNTQSQLTRAGMALGTAAYLPPEQIRGEEVDHRADLFSFGVVAYELIAGERPFSGDNMSAILYAIAHKQPAPVASRSPRCPPRLAGLIETCLAKDPDDRYGGFGEVIAVLDGLAMPATAVRSPAEVPAQLPPLPAVVPLPLPVPPAVPVAAENPGPTRILLRESASSSPVAERPEPKEGLSRKGVIGLLGAAALLALGLGILDKCRASADELAAGDGSTAATAR